MTVVMKEDTERAGSLVINLDSAFNQIKTLLLLHHFTAKLFQSF